jgi:hypothetical protein
VQSVVLLEARSSGAFLGAPQVLILLRVAR